MVRVTEHFLGCIAYLCVEESGQTEPIPRGTAFAVSVTNLNRPDVVHHYLITARHNLELAKTDRVIVRVNTEQGFRDIPTVRNHWHTHDSADVAALLFSENHLAEEIPLARFVGADFPYHFRFQKLVKTFLCLSAQNCFSSVYLFNGQGSAGIFPLLALGMWRGCQQNLLRSPAAMERASSNWHISWNADHGEDIVVHRHFAFSTKQTPEDLYDT